MSNNTDHIQADCHIYAFGPDEAPSEVVTTAVASITNQSPTELPVLNDAIDPGALNRLFDSANRNISFLTVTFEYCGYTITVTPNDIRAER